MPGGGRAAGRAAGAAAGPRGSRLAAAFAVATLAAGAGLLVFADPAWAHGLGAVALIACAVTVFALACGSEPGSYPEDDDAVHVALAATACVGCARDCTGTERGMVPVMRTVRHRRVYGQLFRASAGIWNRNDVTSWRS